MAGRGQGTCLKALKMNHSIEIRFWPRLNLPGWKNAEVTTDMFQWRLSEAQFEEVHGLSRVVRLIPDKLATTFYLHKEMPENPDPQYDKNFLIELVEKLLVHYEEVGQRRDLAALNNIANEEPSLEVKIGNDLLENTQAIALPQTATLLKTVLQTIKDYIQIETEVDYWEMTDEIVKIADKVREACDAYLDVVHPILISSRRAIRPGEATVDELMYKLQEKLETKRNLLLRELRAVKIQLHHEQ